jgi:glutamate-ammonia-ligase adenylyltransferase
MTDKKNLVDTLNSQLAVDLATPDAILINSSTTAWLNKLDEIELHRITAIFSSEERVKQWQMVLSCSQFAQQKLLSLQQLRGSLISFIEPSLDIHWQENDYLQSLITYLPEPLSEKSLDLGLRQWRNAMMVRSIWRDLNRLATTLDITRELTFMADVAIQQALDFHFQQLKTIYGEPQDAQGEVQPLLVIGMGKLGAYELNLSSDIDLIFAYPTAGKTASGSLNGRRLDNQEFFSLLGQRLIKTLDTINSEGFVFRVDMRLRPYGQSGSLVSNFDSLENYYLTQGRDWERYAMVKARIVAISSSTEVTQRAAKTELAQLLRNFTYRNYVDFSVIEALRDLKVRIRQEVKRRRLKGNVKLGEGGIREIEFIVQALQLIRGGRDKQLQTPSLTDALLCLVHLEVLPRTVAEQLAASYAFLRNTEHAIQAWQDKQTQDLPEETSARWALSRAMGFADWVSFEKVLNHHMNQVSQLFLHVIANKDSSSTPVSPQWQGIWFEADQKQITKLLTAVSFDCPEQSAHALYSLQHAPQVLAIDKTGADRLNKLMPLLLQILSKRQNASQTLQRLQPFITAVARRSAYLLLLIENPGALEQLLILSEASPWIPERLATHPALLDELLSPTNLYQIPDIDDLRAELQQTLLRVAEDDLEQQMESLRYFRQAHGLKVAACEVTGRLPLMKVSDYLTGLAEIILQFALNLAWSEMRRKHGDPGGEDSGQPNFIIIGYGKLGGIELGHNSDLDLVFIHNADIQKVSRAGEGQRAIDNQTFYTRMAQKIIHLLNTNTSSGILYEVDMRLRPSGNSGMLVTSLKAFEHYQNNSAWTWEHQALVRTRVVAGDQHLAQAFSLVREQVLCKPRDLTKLKQDVVDMRQKMLKQLGSSTKQKDAGEFHLKQDSGGIVDIEFMVQYAVLAHACSYPSLTRYSDNIRLLGCLSDCGLLSAQEATELIEAYKVFRATLHSLALQQQSARVTGGQFLDARSSVTAIWNRLLQ